MSEERPTIKVHLLDGTEVELFVDEIACVMPLAAWPDETERGQG